MQIRRQRPRTAANGFEKQDEASEAFKDIIIKYNIINDMTRHKLSGAGAAIPTPFTPDGRVDYPALARTIDYIIDGGVDFIVALGTTAETPTLYLHERAVVAMFIKNHIAGRVPLVIGVGGNSTSEVLDQLREFDLRGAVLASDAYFPFADGVEMADKAGIRAVLQPGGSIRDQLSIDYCNEHDIPMVFTGTRHFKH